jgi:hypothetical protein
MNDSGTVFVEDLPIVMYNVSCSLFGNESKLQHCSFERDVSKCTHASDEFVRCTTCTDYYCSTGGPCVKKCDGVSECSDGEDESRALCGKC